MVECFTECGPIFFWGRPARRATERIARHCEGSSSLVLVLVQKM